MSDDNSPLMEKLGRQLRSGILRLSAPGTTPCGGIILFAGTPENVPDGWVTCAGQAISRDEYPDLYEVIGNRFGDGDGKTTFNVPSFSLTQAGTFYIINTRNRATIDDTDS
jgi:hypothetical protein